MIKLFYMETDKAPKVIPNGISEYRKNKILSCKNEKERQIKIAAACVLKAGFSAFGFSEKEIEYGFLKNGKPFSVNHPEIHFSLTHSKKMAVAAFSDISVGVDCEPSDRRISLKLLERFFSEEEAQSFKASPVTLWCAKESTVKLNGDSIFSKDRAEKIPFFENSCELCGIFLQKITILKVQ